MSSTTFVAAFAYKLTAPPAPASTMAAFALMRPSREFSVEARGRGCPLGQTVRKPSAPGGTTVTLSEYAAAVDGIPQALLGMMKSRAVSAANAGPLNGPLGVLRVSAMRQGVMGTYRRAVPETAGSIIVLSVVLAVADPPPDTETEFTCGDAAFAAAFTVTVIG